MDLHDPATYLNHTAAPKPPAVDLRFIVEVNEYVCTFFGFFLNCLLCYLITFKTSTKLRNYKPVLLQNCLLDIFYTFTNAITHAQVEFKQGNFFILMNGPFAYTPYPWNGLLVGLWVFALFFCVTGVPIQFIFRYCIVVRQQKLSRKEYGQLLAVSSLLALLYAVLWTVVNWPYPEIVLKKAHLLAQDRYYYAGIPSFLTAEIWRIDLQLVFTYCYALVGGSYAIIIYTSIKVFKRIKTSSFLSDELLDAHKQLTVTLMAQAGAPVVVCLLPIVICVTGCFLYVDIPGLGLLVTLPWSYIPLTNSIIALTAIKTYRHAMLHFVKKASVKIKSTSAIFEVVYHARHNTVSDLHLHELNFTGPISPANNVTC